ncbi:Fructan 6-exohydrolase [Linum grandiflorum]
MALIDTFSLLSVMFVALLSIYGSNVVDATHREPPKKYRYHQPYRTGFHFQPPRNWINDPNGPMVHKGIYHLFYQYNPNGSVWDTHISWGHATSKDLINWSIQPNAISPSDPSSDINGAWSGSATLLPGSQPVILYTGIDSNNQQVQNLASPKDPSDPYLVEWTKSPRNPILFPTARNHINGSSFRDPSTAWFGPDHRWRVVVGSQVGTRGVAILYKSLDFVHWDKVKKPVHSARGNGMWECLDVYPVSVRGKDSIDTSESIQGSNVKFVLKVSLFDIRRDYYMIGNYSFDEDVFKPDNGSIRNGFSGLRYDYGKFYASKSFYDGTKNRRVLWGWVNESSRVEDDLKKGWAGVMAIPRRLWLDPSGQQLQIRPVEEIKKLRVNPVRLPKQMLNGSSMVRVPNVTASQADVEITFEGLDLSKAEVMDPNWISKPQVVCTEKGTSVKGSLGPFGLKVLASKGFKEFTSVFFRVFKNPQNNKYMVLMCSDQSKSSLRKDIDKASFGTFVDVNPVHHNLPLRVLIDHSIVESFGGNGKSCITARVYPKLAVNSAARLYAFNYGTESVRISRLRAWSMKNARIHPGKWHWLGNDN